MAKRKKTDLATVPLSQAAQKLTTLMRQLPDAPEGRIAITVRGQVRAWLVLHVEPAEPVEDDGEPTRKVKRLIKRALKAARE